MLLWAPSGVRIAVARHDEKALLPCNAFRARVMRQWVTWVGSIITGTDENPLAVLS